MEATKRKSPDALNAESLLLEPEQYTLFGLLRLLEREEEARPRLGAARRPSLDVVRLEQAPHLTFAPGEIAYVDQASSPSTVSQYGLGMMGPNGALPLHLTEWIYERERGADDPALADFVNAIQRRLLALVYRAWAAVDPVANYDRPDEDDFRLYVGALVGLADPSTRGQAGVDDRAVLGRAGLFACGSRPADALESIVASQFEVAACVIPFVPEWLEVPATLWSRLGDEEGGATLGGGLTLGNRSWQCQFSCEIVLGPLTLEQFRSFLPGGTALDSLRALVARFTGDEWNWRLRLVLQESAVPRAQLGAPPAASVGAKLGWDTWLGDAAREARDVVLRGASESRI